MKGAVRLIAQRLFHGKGEVDLQFFIGGFTTKFARVLLSFYTHPKRMAIAWLIKISRNKGEKDTEKNRTGQKTGPARTQNEWLCPKRKSCQKDYLALS